MKYSTSVVALAAVGTVSGSPITTKRDISDIDILNYALTLEHLEDKFYREGLANYTQADFIVAGFAEPFYSNLKEISNDEMTHVSFLTKALGSAAVAECTYSFPSTDPTSFVALASVLEGVVSPHIILDTTYLTAAGSILTVESRHSTYLLTSQKKSPFPTAFDTPLSFNETYTLAAPFILSCPSSNAALPIKAFPALTLNNTSKPGPIASGDEITLLVPDLQTNGTNASTDTSAEETEAKGKIYAAFITATGPIFADAVESEEEGRYKVVVPQGVGNGQSYVVLTMCDREVSDDTVVAGPVVVEVGN
ncbi:hypothetical protein G7Y89_g9019 [Cudoniella acicularis]|uniref:Uncharacterized protein n=1 Tax=Cudoniella acicularis TaxID=354080 RepID=A0A8H4W2B2_9HELO|nr:hypothetical protein G7Y89_g9019 [Cudoniella acicularis]